MQVSVERTGPCQARVHFTVASEEYRSDLRRALSNAGRNVKMKGFRPGHVPPQVIERQFGKQIRAEAIEHYVRQAFEKAVSENELKVVGFKRVDVDEVKIEDGADISHQFEVSLRPEIELGAYKEIAVESELEPVMDAEIDAAIENLRAQQAHPEPAGDEGLPATGMALAKIEWSSEAGETVLAREGLRLSPQTPSPGVDPQAFEQALVGVKNGESRDIPMVFPEDFERAELRGRPGTCRVSVAEVYRMVPPTDAELRALLKVEDEAGLQQFVRGKLEEAKAERENQRIESALIERLIAEHRFELPAMMLEEQTQARLAQFRRQIEQGTAASPGTPTEPTAPAAQAAPTAPTAIEEQVEAQRTAAGEAAAKGLRALFLIQAIAEAEKLLVAREDMQREIDAIAARNQASVEEVNEYYKKNNLFDQMAVEILERKVRRFLRENARITEPA